MLRLIPGRDFRLILSAGIVSQLGDWSARLALAILVLERSGSAATVGVVAVLFTIPWLGVGQALTAWSSRFPRRRVMMTCDALRAAAFIVIGTMGLGTVPLLVIVGLAALVDPVFEATRSAFVTEIVPRSKYSEAVQATHVANQASSLAGYALGGVLVGFYGAETTLTLNGLSFAASTLLIALITHRGDQHGDKGAKPSLGAGVTFLRVDSLSAVGFVATVLAVTTAMSVESQVAVYGRVVAELSDQNIGLLSAVTPAATLVAVAFMKTGGNDTTLLTRGLLIAAAAAASAAALFFAGVEGALAFVAFFLVGVIFSFVTMTNVVVGRRLPDKNRVSIFSILQTGVFLGLSLGALLGGVISDATSPETAAGWALVVCAVGMVVAVPFAFERPRHSHHHQRTRWSR